jgi:hypothetical protein
LIDATGNVYSSGGIGYTASTDADVRLVKYSPSGSVVWSRNYGVAGQHDWSKVLAFGAGGVIHELSASTSASIPARISAWDSLGNLVWSKVMPAPSIFHGMTVGAQGEILCYGSDPGNAVAILVSPSGQTSWTTTLGGSQPDEVTGAAQDGVGNWYLSLHLDVTSPGAGSAGVAKLDSAGQLLWLRTYPGIAGASFRHIAVTPDGFSVAAGRIKVGGASFHMFLAAHDGSGALQWTDTPTSQGSWDQSEDVAIDAEGIAWIAGLQLVSFTSMTVYRYSRAGSRLSTATLLGTLTHSPRDAHLRLGSAGQAFVLCALDSLSDLVLCQLDSTGALTWSELNPPVAHQPRLFLGGVALSSQGRMAIVATEGPNLSESVTTMQLDLNEQPQAYCSAKLNSSGCFPSMGFQGQSSAAASSGFTLRVTQALANRSGLFLYGISGSASIPFQGGTLCIGAPIRRTPVINSGGTSACSGIYALDMNAFAQGSLGGTPLPALSTPGTAVHCQAWGRDTGFPAPNDTSLSNGLRYVVLP